MAILFRKFPSVLATLSIGALLASGFAASAGDDHTPVKGLPGVSEDAARESRVRPAGEPVDTVAQPDADGFVRVGDWDVKVSGSVTIDIGTFDSRSGR